MAKRVFKTDLSVKGIEHLKKELINYKNRTLPSMCKRFVERLAQEGISVANQNVGSFKSYLLFMVVTEPKKDGCKALLLAKETGKIINSWQTKDGIKSAEISPLLMTEFGSGWGAENPMSIPGVGQGTFPGQTHAFDKEGWYWQDLDGNWKHSKGITARMPMYKASEKIRKSIKTIAKEVSV